ncbi:unnamed protein product [Urochloa decumbens]|uniref:PDZ domain-containing protein n=1 Tax=Urochloa decumbens TaxID=240449 RepID=A0ABC9GNX5_9POAL
MDDYVGVPCLPTGCLLSVDPNSEDRSNASHKEVESSRTGELSPLVEEQRGYNLRPRKDDSVTIARRREQQNQRIKRKEAEILRQEELDEHVRRATSRIREMISKMPKQRDKEDEDLKNRTEIINTDTSGVMEMEKWRPYFLRPDIGLFKTTLKGTSWAVEELALQVAPSVVALQSVTAIREDPFYCSGTIFESCRKTCSIVTVANLVKNCPDKDELAEGLEINVCLQNHQTCIGKLLYHDFYYNVCVVQIESPVHLPKQDFNSNIGVINFDESCSRDVVALGRGKETHTLMVNTGRIVPKSSDFDCEELLVSTCRISKADVGGPLMNFDGDFVGLNYYHHKETPFIPSFIVLKCLQQFKLFRKVVRPWHGLRVRTLFGEGCNQFKKMQKSFCGTTGVIIQKIEEQSSAKTSGLNEGDIMNRVNGVYFSNAAELGGILLDIGTMFMLDCQGVQQLDDSYKMCKFGVRGCEHERTIVVDKPTPSGLNRWPFPKPIIVKKYIEGVLEKEEWYAIES